MTRSRAALTIRDGQGRRPAVIVAAMLAWGLLAMTAAGPATGGAHAGAIAAGKPKLTVLKPSQARVAGAGILRVRIASPRPAGRGSMARGRQRVRVTATLKQSWTGRLKAGSARVNVPIGGSRVVRLRLGRRALAAARNCGAAVVDVRAKARRRGAARAWRAKVKRRLTRQASRCAVPKDVDLAHAGSCEWIDDPANPCLGTFPNDYFTRKDPDSGTGLRLNLAPDSTPVNRNLVHIGVDALNTSDGFSPGPLISIKIPGLDNQPAFDRSGLVSEADMSRAFSADQPALLIDAKTGARQLIWAELNSNAPTDAERTLIIRPGRNLTNGRRYIVALRNLKDGAGRSIEAPAGFRLYRDNDRTANRKVESRRAHFDSIFKTLGRAGVKRHSLYLAWDFTVASTANITGRMLSIRDRAFAELGDTDLTDGTVQGRAPGFSITQVDDYSSQTPPYSGDGVEDIRKIVGTFQVPCYLAVKSIPGGPDCGPGSSFKLDGDGLPVREPGSYFTARFKCNIPRSAVYDDGGTWKVDHKVRPSLYGHGLFGDIGEVSSRNIRQLGTENGVMVCGTDWIGMAEEDVTQAGQALMDLSKFPRIPDRLQQGFLNFLYLGRLMIHPDGLASDPNFRFDGQSVIDTSDLFYYGNSQGGIAGGALTAVATDFTRSVLYVPAMNYSTLLPRSVDFADFEVIMRPYYPSQLERPLIFGLMQTMWDRGEPNGYASHMTSDPLPNTPAHKVLIMMAFGDHQVANVATEVEARTIGAPLRLPAVGNPAGIPGTANPPDRLAPGMIKPWVDHETLGPLSGPAADGSAFFVWDIGPKRIEGGQLYGTDPAPLANIPPKTTETGDPFDSGSGIDPHDTVIRSSPIARKQIADFIKTNGKVTDPCGANPCWAAGWQGMP